MRRAPFWSAHACRRSTAALASGSISSQRLSFRPGFLGRGLNGRYPPSPVPTQGCTSHPGHNAGRHDAQAARERTANPPAGTALAPVTRCASAPCPSKEGDYPGLDFQGNPSSGHSGNGRHGIFSSILGLWSSHRGCGHFVPKSQVRCRLCPSRLSRGVRSPRERILRWIILAPSTHLGVPLAWHCLVLC